MKYKERIKQICQEQTDLKETDIAYLVSKADELVTDSSYLNDDVFIDVKNIYTANNAVVIFHKKPKTGHSLYEKSVVGSEAHWQNEPGVIRTLQTGMPSIGLSARSQEGLAIYQTVFPITRENRVIGTLIIESDISRMPSQFILKKRLPDNVYELYEQTMAERFALLTCIDDAALVFDRDGYLIYANKIANDIYCQQLGYLDSIKGMHYDNLVLDSLQFDALWRFDVQKDQEYDPVEVQYGTYSFSIKRHIIKEDNVLVMVYKDITKLRKVESQLLTQVTSLREMNHRVKNNLQTVVSLLRLQAQQSKEKETQKALYGGVNRVLSIASMHDLLSSKYEDDILIETLLKKVAENVQRCFMGHLDIKVVYHIEENIFLDSSRATALALIVNELLQNSYDHAFQKRSQRDPQIHLQLTSKNGITVVSIKDNGSGYNTSTEVPGKHLGLLLVSRFVQSKLSGKLQIHSDDNGTVTKISFKT